MKDVGKVFIAAAAGFVAGGIAGILFAPSKGTETRQRIADGSRKMVDSAKEKYEAGKARVSGWKERMKGKNETVNLTPEEVM